jgi:hypothetical protein
MGRNGGGESVRSREFTSIRSFWCERPDPQARAAAECALGYIQCMRRLAAMAVLLASGCSSGDNRPGPSNDAGTGGGACTFSCLEASTSGLPLSRQVRIIIGSCAGADCHNMGAGGLQLSPGSEFGAIVGVPSVERPELLRVRPGDPLRSYVYLKVACDGGTTGSCMPPGGASPGVAQTFYDWIEAGAPTM